MKNYYKVLGISESATINEIVDAYKMLAPQYHPDNNKGDDYAQERFIDLSVAYKTLINSDIRKDYDRILKGTLETDKGSATAVAATAIRTATHVDLHDNISKDGEHNTKLNKTVRYVAIFSIIFIVASIAITVGKVMKRDAQNNTVATSNDNSATTIAKATITPVVSNTPIVENNTTAPTTADKDNAKPDVVATSPAATTTPKIADDLPEKKVVTTKTTSTPPVVADKKNTTTTSNKTNTPKADDAETTTVAKPTTVQSFAVNANKSTVLTVQGTPTSIVRYDNNTEIWSYGNSKVVFVNGVVASFKNADNNLKAQ